MHGDAILVHIMLGCRVSADEETCTSSSCSHARMRSTLATGKLIDASAQVGNAFTFDVRLVGSLTRIQADAATCGPGGGATPPGATSTGLQALSWTSTKRGISRVTPCDNVGDYCTTLCDQSFGQQSEGAALTSPLPMPGAPAA
jgi:hypothetical protein